MTELDIQKWSTLCNDMKVDSSLPFLSEHTSVVLTSSCSSPLHFSVRVDSCLIRAAAVTTSSSFMSLLFIEYQTNMAVLFLNTCQYFHSFCLSGGSCALIYDEELLTISVLFWYLLTLEQEVRRGRREGGGRRRVSPIPEIHLKPVCKQHGGEGPRLKSVSQFPQGRRGLQILQAIVVVPTLHYSLSLWHVCHTHLLLCCFSGSSTVQ